MKEKYTSNFLIGLLVGAIVAAVVWYWQKSTAADDGALALLDRLAVEQRQPPAPQVLPAVEPDDLQRVKGIGPVFDGRLRQSGIDTFAKLTALSAEQVADLLGIGPNRANDLLTKAAQIG